MVVPLMNCTNVSGRTPTELLEKATHVRQRRRESAARSRARRAQHFSELEGVNQQLREENQRLKALLNAIEHSNTARLQRKE